MRRTDWEDFIPTYSPSNELMVTANQNLVGSVSKFDQAVLAATKNEKYEICRINCVVDKVVYVTRPTTYAYTYQCYTREYFVGVSIVDIVDGTTIFKFHPITDNPIIDPKYVTDAEIVANPDKYVDVILILAICFNLGIFIDQFTKLAIDNLLSDLKKTTIFSDDKYTGGE